VAAVRALPCVVEAQARAEAREQERQQRRAAERQEQTMALHRISAARLEQIRQMEQLTYLQAGGTFAEFEIYWEGRRAVLLEERVTETVEREQSAMRERVRNWW
jgi:hypothetical protein